MEGRQGKLEVDTGGRGCFVRVERRGGFGNICKVESEVSVP